MICMKNIGEIAKAFRTDASRGWNTTQMAAEVSKRQLPGQPAVKRQQIEQIESGMVRVPRYVAALAKLMGTTTDDLLLGQMPTIDSDQTDATDGEAAGRAAVLAAVNILGICLQRMDAESRKAASHFLQEMAASPTGGWSGRLVDLIEKYSPPGLFEEIGIYVRAGNYSLSSRNHRPKIGSKSGNVQTAAIEKSNEPAGQDNASPSEDRNKDQNRGGDGATGSG